MTTLTDLLESEQADADLGDELHEVREAALARLDTRRSSSSATSTRS